MRNRAWPDGRFRPGGFWSHTRAHAPEGLEWIRKDDDIGPAASPRPPFLPTRPDLTADTTTPTGEAATTQSFEADVSRLLHLMVHSVYSDREIFVRELVSNAADACEKLRYESIAKPELIADGAPFAITIALDKDAKTVTVSDNGVGMSREDLTSGLGTIARSGTKAFLDRLAAEDVKMRPSR